jgi:hypothetical protein
MRQFRKTRLVTLTKVLENGPLKGTQLRKLYGRRIGALDSDLTLLDALDIVERKGYPAVGEGIVVLKKPLTYSELDKLFLKVPKVVIEEDQEYIEGDN